MTSRPSLSTPVGELEPPGVRYGELRIRTLTRVGTAGGHLISLVGLLLSVVVAVRASDDFDPWSWSVPLALAAALALVGWFVVFAVSQWRDLALVRLHDQAPRPELDPRLDLILPEAPEEDGDLGDTIKRELVAAERQARFRAEAAGRSADRWWLVRYWLGIPATLLAGLAGVFSLIEIGKNTQVVVGLLALVGSGLVGAITAMDPAANEANARQRQTRYEHLAWRTRALRVGPVEPGPTWADVVTVREEIIGPVADLVGGRSPGAPRGTAASEPPDVQ